MMSSQEYQHALAPGGDCANIPNIKGGRRHNGCWHKQLSHEPRAAWTLAPVGQQQLLNQDQKKHKSDAAQRSAPCT